MVTEPGADRQMVHADMPYQTEPPLYSIFCALQDVTLAMGPTMFLKGTNTQEGHRQWRQKSTFDDYLTDSKPFVALLKAGDLIVYDPRILHCGCENQPDSGNIRAMFNVGFRKPKFGSGDFGYKGSLRTGYTDKITFGDIIQCLSGYQQQKVGPTQKQKSPAKKSNNSKAQKDPFQHYGNGLD